MSMIKNISIRHKHTLIIMLTSSVVLLLACAAFVAYDRVVFRKELIEDVSILADVIGENCAAAIDFNDPKAAAGTLTALRANDNIISACVYSSDGAVFAIYQRDATSAAFVPPATSTASKAEFTEGQLHVFRPITQRGELTGSIFVASDLKAGSARLIRYVGIVGLVFLVSLLLAFLLSNRLQRLISGPILQLAQVARSVAQDKNYAVRATKESNDELGQLVEGFNEMLAQIQTRDAALLIARDNLEQRITERTQELELTHKKLLDTSRQAGMAEVATNVLHNVGNVLNSVNVSTSVVMGSLKKSKVSSLDKVVTLLRQHESDLGTFFTSDPKGTQLPAYLTQLSAHLLAEQMAMLKELDSVQENIEHIKEIVAMQQSYAKVSGIKEVTNLRELVEDSLRMNMGALDRHGVKLIREFEDVPLMNTEKHKILQILINLVRNAKYACGESGRTDKQMTVCVTNSDKSLAGGDGGITISVEDNGVGIPPENLTRIFSRGFTTRKDGHGFGLHSGALAAKEMGGSLTVHSDGVGRGAKFTLEMPFLTEGEQL